MSNGYRITTVTTPATNLALVTLAEAKEMLGIPAADTSHDAEIDRHIAAVSAAVNNYCSRIFVVQSYRDQVRNMCGRLGQPLVTRQMPIVIAAGLPVVAVAENGNALNPAMFEADPDTGSLYRLDAGGPIAWTEPLIVVDYTAGFNPVPPDVQAATMEWLRFGWSSKGRDPALRSETAFDVAAYTYFDWAGSGSGGSGSATPPVAAMLLQPYQLITV